VLTYRESDRTAPNTTSGVLGECSQAQLLTESQHACLGGTKPLPTYVPSIALPLNAPRSSSDALKRGSEIIFIRACKQHTHIVGLEAENGETLLHQEMGRTQARDASTHHNHVIRPVAHGFLWWE